jgi:tetratricopeptide (TPR) repeat protein
MRLNQLIRMFCAILRLKNTGLANCLSSGFSQVKLTLSAELAKLQEEAQSLRCAYSKRLAHEPVKGPDGRIYEQKVIEEWIIANSIWPNSSTPVRAAPTEVDQEMKTRVEDFSLRALEVVRNCIRSNEHKETAVAFAAECLGVLATDLNEVLRVKPASDASDTVIKYRAQAAECRAQTELELAELFDQAASLLSQGHSFQSLDLARIYYNIVGLYRLKGNYPQAEKFFQKSLSIRLKTLPAKHPDLALIYNNLGGLYSSQGQLALAEEYLHKCLSSGRTLKTLNYPLSTTA